MMEKITSTKLQITNNIQISISNNQNVWDFIPLTVSEKGQPGLAFRSLFFEIYLESEIWDLGFNEFYFDINQTYLALFNINFNMLHYQLDQEVP